MCESKMNIKFYYRSILSGILYPDFKTLKMCEPQMFIPEMETYPVMYKCIRVPDYEVMIV